MPSSTRPVGTVGSDIYVGWVDPTSPKCAQGCLFSYSTGVYDLPLLDPSNVTLITAGEIGKKKKFWNKKKYLKKSGRCDEFGIFSNFAGTQSGS